MQRSTSPRRHLATLLWGTAWLGLALATGASRAAPAAPAAPAAVPDIASCTLIDTDFDLDDLMAIPLVIGQRRVGAIVVTEGVVQADRGAAALQRFIADPSQRPLPLIVGTATQVTDAVIDRQWGYFLPDSRRMMHRGLGLALPEGTLPAVASPSTAQQVQDALAPCQQVDVLLLGPFSSFVGYSPLIRHKIAQVVIMGKPYPGEGAGTPAKLPFNCSYDLTACRQAATEQLPGLRHAFVDVPRSAFDGATVSPRGHEQQVYGPTLAMVQGLATTGLPNVLRQALLGRVEGGSLGDGVPGADYWAIDCCLRRSGKSLMWDPMAALYLVHPEWFSRVDAPDGHFETHLSPDAIRQGWTEATNGAVVYHP